MNSESLIAFGYDLAKVPQSWLNLVSLFFLSMTELWLYSVIATGTLMYKFNFKTDFICKLIK